MRSWISPCRAPLVALVGENGAGKTNLLEALSLFTPGRGLRRAELAEMARQGGAGGFAVSIALDSPSARHGSAPASTRRTGKARSSRLVPHRRRAAPSPVGLCRTSPGRLADARSRRAVSRPAGRPPALSRPAGPRGRCRARRAGQRARTGAAVAQPGARGDAPTTRSWLDAVEREVAELAIAVAAARRETVERLAHLMLATRDDALAVSVRDAQRSRARSTSSSATLAGGRCGGPLPGDPARRPRARPGRRAHACRTAGLRPPRAPRPEGHPGRHGLDRRAEGAAHRPRPGPCATRRDDERHRAPRPARRGRRPSRPAPPGGPLRGPRGARRPGLDDRRRSRPCSPS